MCQSLLTEIECRSFFIFNVKSNAAAAAVLWVTVSCVLLGVCVLCFMFMSAVLSKHTCTHAHTQTHTHIHTNIHTLSHRWCLCCWRPPLVLLSESWVRLMGVKTPIHTRWHTHIHIDVHAHNTVLSISNVYRDTATHTHTAPDSLPWGSTVSDPPPRAAAVPTHNLFFWEPAESVYVFPHIHVSVCVCVWVWCVFVSILC